MCYSPWDHKELDTTEQLNWQTEELTNWRSFHLSNVYSNGRIEGHVLIFSCENSKIVTNHWTIIDRIIMLDPTKKDTTHPGAKEKPQQVRRSDKIAFRIKHNTHQNWLECSNKTVCPPGPRRKNQWPHKTQSQTFLWGSKSLQWRPGSTVAAMGSGARNTTVLA